MKTEWFRERTDKQINGTKQRAQKQTPINTVNSSWTKEQSNTTEQRQSLQQIVLEPLNTKTNLDADLTPITGMNSNASQT